MISTKLSKIHSEIIEKYSNEVYSYRKLNISDYDKDYFGLLKQLTISNKPSREDWENRFNLIEKNDYILIVVAESIKEEKVIGTITLLLEPKFIRSSGICCHIEDVVVDKNHRQNKIGTNLINIALEIAKEIGCYKLILDCDQKVQQFYEKCGFVNKNLAMVLYLNKQ